MMNFVDEINQSLQNENFEKVEYLIFHLIENSNLESIIKTSIMDITNLIHLKNAKKIIYKMILINKKFIPFRLLLIDLYIIENQYTKAIKWSYKTLKIAHPRYRYLIFSRLAFIFSIINRPERARFFLYLCNQIESYQKIDENS